MNTTRLTVGLALLVAGAIAIMSTAYSAEPPRASGQEEFGLHTMVTREPDDGTRENVVLGIGTLLLLVGAGVAVSSGRDDVPPPT